MENDTNKTKLSRRDNVWLTVIGVLAIVGAFVLLYWCLKWLTMWPVWVLYFIGVIFFAFRIKKAFDQKDSDYAWKCIWGIVIAGIILLIVNWLV